MKTEYCVHFTRYYTKGRLKGLSPKSSLVFSTLESAKRWVKNAESNGKLDYILRDVHVTEVRVEASSFGLGGASHSTWHGKASLRPDGPRSEQERDVGPARKFTDFTEEKHQARWFRSK
jgi:hypothetical protein